MYFFRLNFCLCLLVALLKLPAYAADLTLAWIPGTDPMVVGYNLYFGSTSGVYTNKISVGQAAEATVSGLIPGTTYYFAATAYSATGRESSLSSEVSSRVPPIVAPMNRTPTLNAIGKLTVSKNAGLQTVTLTGITAGATDENQILTIKAVSSNPGLIPCPTVDYTSPNPAGTLTFRPAADKTGAATITVTVNDGGASHNIVTRKFTVKVASTTTTGSRPVLICALTNQVALPGQTRTLAVNATGRGTLKYQWKYNGAVLASAVSSMLTLENVTTNQSGVYSVMVTDRNGSTGSAASLTVYATAAGTLAPAGQANGQYAMNVDGVPGCRYIVQASTDFANWVPVQTNTAPFTFVDTAAGRFKQRFYRSAYIP